MVAPRALRLLHLLEAQGGPGLAHFLLHEAQAEALGMGLQGGHVGLVEAAEQEGAARTQHADVGRHVGKQDVAVDVGDDEVEGVAAQQAGVANTDGDVGMVSLGVLKGVVVGPLVDVDAFDIVGTTHLGQDGQHGGATAHVEDMAALHIELGEVGEHHVGGLVVGGAKGHLGLDFEFPVYVAAVLVEGGANPHTFAVVGLDKYGFVLFFPFFVPVFVGHGFKGVAGGGHVLDVGQLVGQPGFVEVVGRHVGFEAVGGLDKAVVGTFVAKGVDKEVAEGVVLTQGDGYFDVLHFFSEL